MPLGLKVQETQERGIWIEIVNLKFFASNNSNNKNNDKEKNSSIFILIRS